MFALLGAVLTASFVGSPHCVGMCGPVMLLAVPNLYAIDGRGPGSALPLTTYHLGRLLGYMALGAIAGVFGSLVNLSGNWLGLQRAASIAAGVGMMTAALVLIVRLVRGASAHGAAPPWLVGFLAPIAKRLSRFPSHLRGLGVGLLTTLLPCGWLYAFVISAAATG